MRDTVVTVEIGLISPLRGDDLADQFHPVVVQLDLMEVDFTTTCAAADGEVSLWLYLDRHPGETLAELAVRGTSALRKAMQAAGAAPDLYTESSVRVSEPVAA